MPKDYMPLPFELLDELDCLTDEEYGYLVRAMQRYHMHGEDQVLEGTAALFWKRCRNIIDRYNESYEKLTNTRSENGKKGGRPKKQPVISETEEKLKKLPVFSETEEKLEKPSVTVTVTKSITNNIPPKSPKGDDFELFWQSYPKKVGKDAARKAFDKVKEPVESLLTAVNRQKCSRQWQEEDGRYIPNPSTWLNQGRWKDEVYQGTGYSGKPVKPGDIHGCSGLGEAELDAIRQIMAED